MSTFFPKHTVHWHFEEPTILRRFSISIWEVAVLTGVTLRLYRALVITSGSTSSWVVAGGTFALGLLLYRHRLPRRRELHGQLHGAEQLLRQHQLWRQHV